MVHNVSITTVMYFTRIFNFICSPVASSWLQENEQLVEIKRNSQKGSMIQGFLVFNVDNHSDGDVRSEFGS